MGPLPTPPVGHAVDPLPTRTDCTRLAPRSTLSPYSHAVDPLPTRTDCTRLARGSREVRDPGRHPAPGRTTSANPPSMRPACRSWVTRSAEGESRHHIGHPRGPP